MKKQLSIFAIVIFMISTLFPSCKKDAMEENEEEVITTMKLTFVPVGGGTNLEFSFDDPDGPGGAAPTQQAITLAAAKTYNVTVQLLNKTASPAEDITDEVNAESDAHRFYYAPSAGSNITVAGLNNDASGIPLGITSVWTTGTAAIGKIKVTLRHYPANPPDKAAADAVNSPKSGTDIEVEFDTTVQ